MRTTLRNGIEWVGYVDWTVRDFHGYHTGRGSTYNAYLVRDEKTALIDTVKAPYAGDLLKKIAALTPPDRVNYIVCNHAEPDHAGGFPEVLRACPNAEVVCTERCRKALGQHHDAGAWRFRIVGDGERLSLGSRALVFFETPMVHWPESTFTYVPEEKLLFSMDAFGQHLATTHRFDDEVLMPLDLVMFEAKTYYANIVMPYGKQVRKTLDRAAGLEIETIAPSHGVIWRKHVAAILSAYRDWAVCKAVAKVVTVYDSMWGGTAAMARAIAEGASVPGVEAQLCCIRDGNVTALATEVLDAACLAVGSPTLNQAMMPEVAGALTYLKGLKPVGKAGFAFGSYGWGKNGPNEVDSILKTMQVEITREPIVSQYVPTPETLEVCREAGTELAAIALKKAESV